MLFEEATSSSSPRQDFFAFLRMNPAPQHRLTKAYHDVSKTTDQYELTALQRSVTNPGQINNDAHDVCCMKLLTNNVELEVHGVYLLPVCLALHPLLVKGIKSFIRVHEMVKYGCIHTQSCTAGSPTFILFYARCIEIWT